MKLSVRAVGIIAGAACAAALFVPAFLATASPLAAQTDLRSDKIQNSLGFTEAYRMSDAFRTVSKQVMPAVVSIKTEGKVIQRTVSGGESLPPDRMLQELFGSDPRFESFFRKDFSTPQRRFKSAGGQGSGFIVDPSGIVLTNAHVVDGAGKVTVMLEDGREFEATEVSSDERADVAVLRIEAKEELPYLVLGNDDQVEIGDWVLAFGSPFGLHRTVTQGIISAKGRGLSGDGNKEFLQTDAAVNPGNSGGPLVNLRGEVIGMNTAISTRSGGYDGVSLAVPANLVRWASEQLQNSGRVERAYVGIQMQEVNAQLAKSFKLSAPQGVVVTGVVPDSPADEAGLLPGDVILKVNGRNIQGQLNMLGTVEQLAIGKTYPLEVLRNGAVKKLEIAVAVRPENFATMERGSLRSSRPDVESNSVELPELDLQVQDLTSAIARDLNLPDEKGVVVTTVVAGGVADEAGIRPGMVISSVANTAVDSALDLKNTLRAAASEKSRVLLLVKIPNGNSAMARFVSVPLNR